MTANQVYLDYNATAPIRPPVIDRMAEVMAMVGNPSSVHGFGRKARRLIDQARQQVAALVSAPPAAVVFTSGGTEANNQALARVNGPVLVSAIEHESVLRCTDDPELVPVDSDGKIDLQALSSACDRRSPPPPAVISVMLANNETGVIQPIRDVTKIAADRGIRLHVDVVQAAGKIPIDFFELGAYSLSLSAHKLGGPQGVGALIVRDGTEPAALLKGGAQEHRFRAGTENVAGIVGFGMAAELALNDQAFAERVALLRDQMEAEILAMSPDTRIFGANTLRLPNTSCLTMPGVSHETQLIAFDLAGIAVSSGSACSSGKVGPSHVLAAMGVSDKEANTAIRVSFGWASSKMDVERLTKVYHDIFEHGRARQKARGLAEPAAGYG
ncbi:MAG: cysteine desulfurase family protein [Geminicoccaceae bacterium]